MKQGNPEYLDKVKKLKPAERERLLSRMTGKLPRRLEKDKLSEDEAIAIQMELEDEQLREWREKMHAIQAKEAAKAAEKEVPKKKAEPRGAAAPAEDTAAKPAAKKSKAKS